jgi:hypothetical protein
VPGVFSRRGVARPPKANPMAAKLAGVVPAVTAPREHTGHGHLLKRRGALRSVVHLIGIAHTETPGATDPFPDRATDTGLLARRSC